MSIRMLEKRVTFLEKLVYERSVSKGAPTKALQLWNYLADNGPKTAEEIKAALPNSIYISLNFFLKNNLIIKNGSRYAANLDYEWDDVGKISRQSNIANTQSVQDETPTTRRTNRRQSAQSSDEIPQRNTRQTRQRSVKADIWSFKINEIKAALDNGENVNQRNDKRDTPLSKAVASKSEQAFAAAEYLLNHGADANILGSKGIPLVYQAAKSENGPMVKLLVDHGANPALAYGIEIPLFMCFRKDIFINSVEYLKCLINDELLNNYLYNICYQLTTTNNSTTNTILQDICDEHMSEFVKNEQQRSAISNAVSVEIRYKSDSIILKSALENNYFPRFPHEYTKSLPQDTLNAIYNAAKNRSDQLIIADANQYTKAVTEVCKLLGKSSDFLDNNITVEMLRNTTDLREIAMTAVRDGNVDLLAKIVKTGRKDAGTDTMLRYVARENPDRKVTSLACRLMNSMVLAGWDEDYIAKSDNEYLIEWYIDKDQDNLLKLASVSDSRTSETVKRVLRENDAPTGNKLYNIMRSKEDKRLLNSYLDSLRYAVTQDEFRKAQQILKEYPAILDNEDAVDIITDPKNDDSFTARELRKMLNEKPVSKYNF